MHVVLTLVGIVTVVIAVAGLSSRLDLPSPLVLIVVGVIGSYLPFVPDVQLEPEIVLFGLLPPLLYAAALQTSLVDFNANRRAILLLSVGLVAFTTVGCRGPGARAPARPRLAAAPSRSVPSSRRRTPWPRPTIGRRIGLPRRIVTILEGESLLNDATALVALRTAIVGDRWRGRSLARDFLVAAGGGIAVGLAFFIVIGFVRKHVTDPRIDSGLSFLTPFAAYVVAEEIHASGVISVVVAGLLLGHNSQVLQTAQSRIVERMNWRSIAFLLEGGGLPADRPAGARDHRQRSRRRGDGRSESSCCARAPWSRSSCCGWCGSSLARYLLHPAGTRGRHRQATSVDLHVPRSAGPACAAWSRWRRRS